MTGADGQHRLSMTESTAPSTSQVKMWTPGAASSPRALRAACLLCGLVVVAAIDVRSASADRYEAMVAARPVASVGRFSEDVTRDGRGTSASTFGAGTAVAVGYGVRNWIDVGAELVAAGFTQAAYDEAQVTVMGSASLGRVTRTSRLVHLHAGPTLRFGVAWVATVYAGVGLGARLPSAGTLLRQGDPRSYTPDGMAADVEFDAVVAARVGFEHRFHRWSTGVAAEVTRTLGLGARAVDVVAAGITVSYRWYPGWW
jgi:hypothetical protein